MRLGNLLNSHWRRRVRNNSIIRCSSSSSNNNSSQKIEAAIERHTLVTRKHLTPELQLHLLTSDCPLYRSPVSGSIEYFEEPFWAFYWPGGQAIARYVLDEGPRLFPRGNATMVLDLGAGCGAGAIAAKISGARHVLANDIDKVACVAVLKNARLNGVEVQASSTDLLASLQPNSEPHFDIILVGDLLYDEVISTRLEAWLEHHCARGAQIYLGDPGRHGLTVGLRRKLEHLRTYQLPENVRLENHGYGEAGVWRFSGGR